MRKAIFKPQKTAGLFGSTTHRTTPCHPYHFITSTRSDLLIQSTLGNHVVGSASCGLLDRPLRLLLAGWLYHSHQALMKGPSWRIDEPTRINQDLSYRIAGSLLVELDASFARSTTSYSFVLERGRTFDGQHVSCQVHAICGSSPEHFLFSIFLWFYSQPVMPMAKWKSFRFYAAGSVELSFLQCARIALVD